MSVSLLTRNTMNSKQGALVDDQQAFQLALEISMLGFNSSNNQQQSTLNHNHDHHHHRVVPLPQDDFVDSYLTKPRYPLDQQSCLYDESLYNANAKKSTNMTETVPVPSSEHVAEIVGRQGCKIKALRAKTNTYIKTPVRGHEPVFVVTGRREDVTLAKREILSAADHFSQIRANRKNPSAGSTGSNSGSNSPTFLSGHSQTEVGLVRVPYKVVGLVVGPKGATIKRIQQATSTYIVTPGRDKDPVFEVTGSAENVERAREEIEKHIANRTGDSPDFQIDDFHTNGIESMLHEQPNDDLNGVGTFTSYNNTRNLKDNRAPNPPGSNKKSTTFPQSHLSCNSSGPGLKISEFSTLPANFNTCNTFGAEVIDDTIGNGALEHSSSIWSDSYEMQRSNSLSVNRVGAVDDAIHPRTRRTNSDPLAQAFQRVGHHAFSSSSPTSSQGSLSPVTARRGISPTRRECMLCHGEVTAALVPCGHNAFCMPCALKICQPSCEPHICPICHTVPTQAIRIRT